MEKTIEVKLRELYTLQLIDSKINLLKTMRGELPIEVSDLEDEIAGLTIRSKKYSEDGKEIQAKIADRQAFIKESIAMIERYNAQLTNVKNSREYDALSKEIEMQDLEKQIADKKIKEFKGKHEQNDADAKLLKAKLEERNKELDIKKKELTSIISETEKEENQLLEDAQIERTKIEERLLKAYDRIRTSVRNGMAVVTIERDSCGGCFNRIPPQVQLDISLRKKINICENCGRILVDAFIESELVK